ncbi:brachyurin-like [Daphnia pulex]|uniref:brachyurin-like n=1 Tax=Daphnia pulex TaxID=6669 RepID=UPI001EE0E6F6|nr:brachyurin-like [Daphnia pulex]
MAVEKFGSLFLTAFLIATASGSIAPLKLDAQEVVLNLQPPSFSIKLNLRNDSSLLDLPWTNGKQQEKVPAPDTTISPIRTTPSRAPSTTPSYSYGDCGVANLMDEETNRIVGGVQAIPNEFLWQAFVKVETNAGNIYYCGGSLIADRWILTSARCVLIPGQTLRYLTIYLGAHDITASYEANRRVYNGYEAYVHPEWNPSTQAGDIALIKLYNIVTYTQYIRPVCLATYNEPSYVNSKVTVAGWGTTSDGSYTLSPVLREVTVPVISNTQCSNYYGSAVITSKVMCTTGMLSRGPCNGDNGGPLIFRESNGRWKQIGIVSFVSSQGCQSGYPYGYTRLSSYSTWVQNVISSYSGSSSTTTTPSSSSGSQTSAILSLVISLLLLMQL